MGTPSHYFVFSLDGQRYALTLAAVQKVIRAVQITPMPDAPEGVLGVINMGGHIIPVLDLRKRLHLPDREMALNDRIVICKGFSRKMAFVVDLVEGVVEFAPEELDEAVQILPNMEHFIEGIGKLNEDVVLIYDLDRLFSIEEVERLEIGD
ncbi:MAG: purine-binding chemotaxis protein CheW [Deltaproteobacteria bacterium]|nr:purine-binding chemotaxis protein CheW [Deltaproteobacteria bacterium]MBW2047581.1 purine-binding chemotaxis protein CheW [Deltaproteobacteria bacterium]MBW2111651.1 purine-binding chemotaxis protein CheW [Deltaproteobacteria bacterium]MBW2352223.1 purine-binding chemotaxis protein CheW [Deltaproteobacteria bacterium]HDZ91045.1 purine-binding chemotaxis protein CheW [Deltaproteobacteria bacterium]